MKQTILLVPLAALAAAVALFTAGTAAAAGTVNCAPYGAGTAADVQAAAASGGIVTINGVCTGRVHLTTAVTLRGGTSGATSGLDGGGTGPVVTITGGPVTLGNLLVRNGSCSCEGAGVSDTGNALNLIGSRILNNHATSFGGGVYAENSGTVTVQSSTISGNVGRYDGGGLMMNSGSNLTVTGSTISNNSLEPDYGGTGGGISQFGAQLTLSNTTLSGNRAEGSGGAIAVQYGTASISRATITGNSAAFGGGGIFAGDVNYSGGNGVTIANSTIDHNTVSSEGGGILNLSFYGNSYVTANNTTFSSNSAPFGGAVNNSGQGATAGFSGTADTFLSNHADDGEGGAIYNEAIYDFSHGLVTLSQSTIGPSLGSNGANTAQEGGAIFNFVYPGYHGDAEIALQNGTTVEHNTAFQTGGGVYNCPLGVVSTDVGSRIILNTPNNLLNSSCG
jgi:predicted outer membrane repeat protein